jgi:tetratricopeptide (TPR) repeat protein
MFRNSITREVAYGGLAKHACALLHSIAADRLVRSPAYRPGADDARLAAHLERAGDKAAAGRALLSAGSHARDNASNSDAFNLFTRALALLPPDAYNERYQVHAEREQILRGLGKRPAQLREVHSMRKAATALADKRLEAEAFSRLGLLYLDVGKHAAAHRELERALACSRTAGDRLGESEALRLEATLLMNVGHNAEAQAVAKQALDACGSSTDRKTLLQRAQALNAIGNVHVHTGHLRDAVSSYAEALVVYRRLGARRLEAAALNNMGWVFVGLGEYEEALVHYKRSLKLAQELGDRTGVGVKLANIGQTYADLGDHERARRYLDKALELHQALGDPPGLTDALISRAQVSIREAEAMELGADAREPLLDEATRGLERGFKLAADTRNRYQEIRALVYLAFCQLLRASGEPARAVELAESATKLAREARIANGEAYGLVVHALALARSGRAAEALRCSLGAVEIVDSGRDLDCPEEILHLHAQVARAAGDGARERDAVRRAYVEVQRKARRLRDDGWRARYLAAHPAREIVLAARAAGVDEPGA